MMDWRHDNNHGFTLVEMLVTISIIAILASLTIAVTTGVMRKSEIWRTRNVLKLLDAAMREWEAAADRKLSWGVNPMPPDRPTYDVGDGTPHVFTLSEVLVAIGRSDPVREILGRIEKELVYTYKQSQPIPAWLPVTPDPDDPDPFLGWGNPRDLVLAGMADGSLSVLDAWDMPIRAVHPGRLHCPGSPWFDTCEKDADGTVFIDTNFQGANEQIYGRSLSRQVYFVSAGPDGKFGHRGSADEELTKQALDNLYSCATEEP